MLSELREAAAAAARIVSIDAAEYNAGFAAGGLTALVEVADQGAIEQAGRAERKADRGARRNPLAWRVLPSTA